MSIQARRLAAIIFWIGHPRVFATACVGIVVFTQLASRAAMPILAALVLSVIVPTAILVFLGVRSGRWRDADVSVRQEHTRFYPVAIPLSAVGTLMSWLVGAPRYILRGGIVTLLLLVTAAITNVWHKISLHTLFASYCTVVLFRLNPIYGPASLLLAALFFGPDFSSPAIFLRRRLAARSLVLLAGLPRRGCRSNRCQWNHTKRAHFGSSNCCRSVRAGLALFGE